MECVLCQYCFDYWGSPKNIGRHEKKCGAAHGNASDEDGAAIEDSTAADNQAMIDELSNKRPGQRVMFGVPSTFPTSGSLVELGRLVVIPQ